MHPLNLIKFKTTQSHDITRKRGLSSITCNTCGTEIEKFGFWGFKKARFTCQWYKTHTSFMNIYYTATGWTRGCHRIQITPSDGGTWGKLRRKIEHIMFWKKGKSCESQGTKYAAVHCARMICFHIKLELVKAFKILFLMLHPTAELNLKQTWHRLSSNTSRMRIRS